MSDFEWAEIIKKWSDNSQITDENVLFFSPEDWPKIGTWKKAAIIPFNAILACHVVGKKCAHFQVPITKPLKLSSYFILSSSNIRYKQNCDILNILKYAKAERGVSNISEQAV